jgi:hypothetical protein
MKAKLENINGVDYLRFTLQGMKTPTLLPVITKGNRDKANVWTWNGSLENPTVRPSVRTSYHNGKRMTEIHYQLNDGICQCLGDCKDGNAGKHLPLIDMQQ